MDAQRVDLVANLRSPRGHVSGHRWLLRLSMQGSDARTSAVEFLLYFRRCGYINTQQKAAVSLFTIVGEIGSAS